MPDFYRVAFLRAYPHHSIKWGWGLSPTAGLVAVKSRRAGGGGPWVIWSARAGIPLSRGCDWYWSRERALEVIGQLYTLPVDWDGPDVLYQFAAPGVEEAARRIFDIENNRRGL